MTDVSDNLEADANRLPRSKSFFPALVQNPFVHRIEFTTWDKIKVHDFCINIIFLISYGMPLTIDILMY